MADIGKLLWPKSVAVVGASSDTHGLRGRILEIMCSHPFAGQIYPVSRSAAEGSGPVRTIGPESTFDFIARRLR